MLKHVEKKNFIRNSSIDTAHLNDVEKIVEDVKKRKEEAVVEYAKKFDAKNAKNFTLVIDKETIEKSTYIPDKKINDAILFAKENIMSFHKCEKENSILCQREDSLLGQMVTPMDRVACYVPGGKAFYPSSVLMTVLPAKIAGVREIIIITPSDIEGRVREEIVYLAKILGVHQIVSAGGAHAIAYAAYGGDNFKKVDKIVGPGNMWVTLAKKLVYGVCDIDMLAGPSEILIVADESANPRYIARDLLSQAEHSEDAICALITTSEKLLDEVNSYLKKFIDEEERKSILLEAIKKGISVVVDTIEEGIDLANEYASEHLEVVSKLSDSEVMNRVKAAGSLFIGNFSSEPLGDYIIGSNHVLPTFGAAKFSSPLGVYDFCRRVNVISANKEYVRKYGQYAVDFAEYEGLYAHANAIKERMKDIK